MCRIVRMDRAYYMAVHHWNKIIETIDEYIRINPYGFSLVSFLMAEGVSWRSDGCVYCKIMYCNHCKGCPIMEYSGSTDCCSTPWNEVNTYIRIEDPSKARMYAIRLRDLIMTAKPKNMMQVVSY